MIKRHGDRESNNGVGKDDILVCIVACLSNTRQCAARAERVAAVCARRLLVLLGCLAGLLLQASQTLQCGWKAVNNNGKGKPSA
jgi:hypothetical protein